MRATRFPAGVGVLIGVLLCLPLSVDAAKPFCGDGKCGGGETVGSCPADCTPAAVCGDGICSSEQESCSTCGTDCGVCPPAVCNNDGVCNVGEDCLGCPNDCPGMTGGKPNKRYCCGLDTCDASRCGPGCGSTPPEPYCGDGNLDLGEECDDGNTLSGDGCSALCLIEVAPPSVPANQFNVGDSIGEGEAADGTIGEAHHETVWSTGYASTDYVDSLNERFEREDPISYHENNSARDGVYNHALSGAVMADFAAQAQGIVASLGGTPSGTAGMVTILLGNNDVCAETLSGMTDPVQFETQFRAGLDVLAANAGTRNAEIHVSGIPAIYWLWEAKRNDFMCRFFIWPFVPCENLLDNAADDCASTESRLNPDVIYAGDGANCARRKQFHAQIRDFYNPILRDVTAQYRANGALPNAGFIDIFDVRFYSEHVNSGDCFHPSEAGHALLAQKQWCRATWGTGDPLCSP